MHLVKIEVHLLNKFLLTITHNNNFMKTKIMLFFCATFFSTVSAVERNIVVTVRQHITKCGYVSARTNAWRARVDCGNCTYLAKGPDSRTAIMSALQLAGIGISLEVFPALCMSKYDTISLRILSNS